MWVAYLKFGNCYRKINHLITENNKGQQKQGWEDSFDSILLQINIHKTAMTALSILHNYEITEILQNYPTFHENILDQSSVDFMSYSITAKQWRM